MKIQEQKHYYGFHQLPNHWLGDNEKVYTDEFFNDKKYEDLYFDNFFDMDQMFGHENSLFGTRGLPVGHPKRTSKSFNQYNERFGPMVVRVVKDTNLEEQISRIQSMMGVINESNFFRRRVDLDKLIPLIGMYADQVFYETEGYDQFKYELTLRAVEDAIQQDFGLGWEELPSNEEIEFVTDISNVFDDRIRGLYKFYSLKNRGH
jgi:hypothetical protein